VEVTNKLVCFVEAVYFYRFVIFHCGYKEGKKNVFITGIWCFLFGLLVAVFNTDRLAPIGIWTALIEICIFCILYLQRGGVYKILIIGMAISLITVVDMSVAIGYMALMGGADSAIQMMEPVTRGLLTILSKIMLVIVLETYFLFMKKSTIVYKVDMTAGVCALYGIVIICASEIFVRVPWKGEVFFTLFGMGLMLFLISLFICNLFKRMQLINDDMLFYQTEIRKQEMLGRHYAESKKLYQSLREYRHDMKHHFAYMDFLLQKEKYEELKEYLKELEV